MLLVGSCGMGLMKWKWTVLGRRCFQTFGGRVISDVASVSLVSTKKQVFEDLTTMTAWMYLVF